jgi:predicted Zn-dependent protease
MPIDALIMHCGQPARHLARLLVRFGVVAVLSTGLVACSSNQTAREISPAGAPWSTGFASGLLSLSERDRVLMAFGGEYSSSTVRSQLDGILARLVAASDEPGHSYRVTILNSPSPNAFALQGGDVFVTRGLLALVDDPSEIAAVMAHELAHITARHASQRSELALRANVDAPDAAQPAQALASSLMASKGQVALASFSRVQELEADMIGVKWMAKAGFDPFGAARILTMLGRDANLRASIFGENKQKAAMNFLASHPSTPERIVKVLSASKDAGGTPVDENERIRWLNAIDGMTYGDDPAQGLIRGRYFVHPKLGIKFAAPDTFVLDNSSSALVGVLPGKPVALRFDRIDARGQTPEQAVQSGWVEGTRLGEVESINSHGFNGATVLAKGQDWQFRLAALAKDGVIYRFIFAAQPLTADLDGLFRQSIGSFNSLSDSEREQARPLRVRHVIAQQGETAETLSKRMGTVERPYERFLVLNGLDRPGLQLGRGYKLIAE